MPKPIDDFDGQAKIYTAPGCQDLPVLHAHDENLNPVRISCWQFTWEELKQIVDNDGKVYLHVWGGGQPPVYVGHENPMNG